MFLYCLVTVLITENLFASSRDLGSRIKGSSD